MKWLPKHYIYCLKALSSATSKKRNWPYSLSKAILYWILIIKTRSVLVFSRQVDYVCIASNKLFMLLKLYFVFYKIDMPVSKSSEGERMKKITQVQCLVHNRCWQMWRITDAVISGALGNFLPSVGPHPIRMTTNQDLLHHVSHLNWLPTLDWPWNNSLSNS